MTTETTIFTEIAMNLYHDIRRNITVLVKNDLLSQNVNK
jgi:hypothetical protein